MPANSILQELIDGKKPIPQDTYYVDTSKPIVMPGYEVDFNSSIIIAEATAKPSCVLLVSTKGARISNLQIQGVKLKQSGIGIKIVGSQDVILNEIIITDMSVDGFYISNSDAVMVYDCDSYRNARNGLSVVSGKNILLKESIFSDNALCGVCVEANANSLIKTVNIVCCSTDSNKEVGIQISCPEKNAKTSRVEDVSVVGCDVLKSRCGIKISNTKDVRVLWSEVRSCSEFAIFSTLSETLAIENCRIANSVRASIYEKRNNVSYYNKNIIEHGLGIGIQSLLSNSTLLNNKISRCIDGINVSSMEKCFVSGNIIEDNSRYGIIHDNTASVSSNTFQNNKQDIRMV